MAHPKRFLYASGVQEAFPFLAPLISARDDLKASFVGRIPGVPLSTDKAKTLSLLQVHHDQGAAELGFSKTWTAEQIHGDKIAVLEANSPRHSFGVDALLTDCPDLLLGIHVADCGAVYLADARTGAIGLLHSGKKGTEFNITGQSIARMSDEFGTRPSDLTVVLGPCIRPPRYEVDFASTIAEQVLQAGVPANQFYDCWLCTGSDLSRFYSYRMEKGCTGRHLALLGRTSS